MSGDNSTGESPDSSQPRWSTETIAECNAYTDEVWAYLDNQQEDALEAKHAKPRFAHNWVNLQTPSVWRRLDR